MKPVTVRTRVSRPAAEVYDHLDVLANHEAFVDHLLAKAPSDRPSGPRVTAQMLRGLRRALPLPPYTNPRVARREPFAAGSCEAITTPQRLPPSARGLDARPTSKNLADEV